MISCVWVGRAQGTERNNIKWRSQSYPISMFVLCGSLIYVSLNILLIIQSTALFLSLPFSFNVFSLLSSCHREQRHPSIPRQQVSFPLAGRVGHGRTKSRQSHIWYSYFIIEFWCLFNLQLLVNNSLKQWYNVFCLINQSNKSRVFKMKDRACSHSVLFLVLSHKPFFNCFSYKLRIALRFLTSSTRRSGPVLNQHSLGSLHDWRLFHVHRTKNRKTHWLVKNKVIFTHTICFMCI